MTASYHEPSVEDFGPIVSPARVRGIRHGACSNIMCPNRAGEGQMATFVLRSRAGASRDVALILCAPCADALVRECGVANAP